MSAQQLAVVGGKNGFQTGNLTHVARIKDIIYAHQWAERMVFRRATGGKLLTGMWLLPHD